MGRQCPSCNKLAGLDTEVDDVSLELDGTSITGTVHVIRRSQCCSEDMKEATFDVDINLLDSNADLEEHTEEGHELEAEFDEGEVTGIRWWALQEKPHRLQGGVYREVLLPEGGGGAVGYRHGGRQYGRLRVR
jgi:hypothetical protein